MTDPAATAAPDQDSLEFPGQGKVYLGWTLFGIGFMLFVGAQFISISFPAAASELGVSSVVNLERINLQQRVASSGALLVIIGVLLAGFGSLQAQIAKGFNQPIRRP